MSSVSVAQASARGTLILFVGNLLSTVVATVAIIIFARLLGPGGYGVYTLAFLVPSILQVFVGLGVGTAVTRYVAYSLSTGDRAKAVSVTRTAIVFSLLFGVALSALDLAVAPYFVVAVLHRPELVQYSQVTALFILAISVSQCAISVLIGWGSMGQVSAFTVLQSVLKLVLGVGLILAGFGVYGAVTGHVASYLVQGIAATLAIYLVRMRVSQKSNHFFEDMQAMARYGLPVFTGNIVSGLASQYATVVLAAVVSNSIIGYYQAALNVTVPIGVISGALASVLFRSFAELHGLREDISLAFAYAVKYVSLLLTPIVFFILAAAGPLFNLFYGPAYSEGVVLLKILAISYLPVSVGLTILPSFLNGVGRSRFTMFVSIASALALALSSVAFIVYLGLGAEGIILALLISNLATVGSGLYLSMKYLDVRLPPRPLLGIFSAGMVAWIVVVLLPVGAMLSIEALVIDMLVYTVAYAALVPVLYGLDEDDLVRLSISVETLGPLRVLFGAYIGVERRILHLRSGGVRKREQGSNELISS